MGASSLGGQQQQHIRVASRDEGILLALYYLRPSRLITHSLKGQLRPPSLYLDSIKTSDVLSHR